MNVEEAAYLKNLPIEELWRLFPIVLSPHNPQWEKWAESEIEFLKSSLSRYYPVVNHIGSTAIHNIRAKPIVDILIEISLKYDWMELRALMEKIGYICMSESLTRMSFNKGYTLRGYADKVFHVHIHAPGDNEEVKFRDFLRTHPEAAKEYESLKLSLLPQYMHDRDGYTEAKTEFIRNIMRLASCNDSHQCGH